MMNVEMPHSISSPAAFFMLPFGFAFQRKSSPAISRMRPYAISANMMPKNSAKNGMIKGLGSSPLYAGREYISVTMLYGRVSALLRSWMGTSSGCSGSGSSVSQAQQYFERVSPSFFSSGAVSQPSK